MPQSESEPSSSRLGKSATTASRTQSRNPRRRPPEGRKGPASGDGGSLRTISVLLEELLQQVGGLPIKTIIHGWPTEPAKDFLATLAALLRPVDSFMLVPNGAISQPPPPELERAFVVDLGKDSHLRTYRNSTFDILFFSFPDSTGRDRRTIQIQTARSCDDC